MKKLLELLGTILITGNALSTVIAVAPNGKQRTKTKLLSSELNYSQTNNLENLQRSKRQNNEDISTTPKIQDEQQSQFSKNTGSQTDIIEKEINLDENYSYNIQKMLQELIDENYIDPLRSINMGGLISKELDNKDNKTIIYKLEELEPKIANWIKEQQNNKEKILILTLKNSNNKNIKLVINLNNLYLLGFINNQNKYFYFDDELLEKIKQHNQEEIKKLNNLKEKLNNLKENKLLFNEEKVKEYLQQKNKFIFLKEKEKNIKKLNYNNELNSLNKKLSNLQGENLKNDEEKIKDLNKSVIKKYSCQKINLNYTGAYTSEGLNVVIKENGKPDKGKNINISNETLKGAISNLADYDNNKQENQKIKDDLVRMIFITSEAMRFQCDKKTLEIFANIKNIDELKKIISESKNILKDMQEKIFNNQTINWEDYTSQLRGDWKKYSEQFNKFRIKIWNELTKAKKIINFIDKNKVDINNILKTENNIDNISKKIQKAFNENQNFTEIKNACLQYIVGMTRWKQDLKSINLYFEKEFYLKTDLKTDDFFSLNSNSDNNILYIFIIQNNFELAKLLIKLNPDKKIINSSDINNNTPLLLAINKDAIDFIKFLLENGADVNLQEKKVSMSIINAINNNNWEIINILFDHGHNVNFQDPLVNNTYLHIAARNGQLELVKLLLERGANPNIQEKKGLTPLYFAAESDKTEVVQELLTNKNSKNTIDINLSNNLGDTPLQIASFKGHHKVVELLLKNHKIDVNKKDYYGDNALIVAARNGKTNVVKELLKHSDIDVNFSNKEGNNALISATFKGNVETVNLLLIEIRKLYKDKEFKEFINKANNSSLTSLQYAAFDGNIELVKLLLSYGADINKATNDGWTPLRQATSQGHIKVKNLLENFIHLKQKLIKNKNEIKHIKEKIKELLEPYTVNSEIFIVEQLNISSKNNTNNYSNTFARLKNIFQKPKNGISSSNVSVGEKAETSGTQNQKTKTTNQNNLYDVPADNSCLFWSVSTSYLLQVRKNIEEFRNRFIQLFGEENLKYLLHIQKLLQQYDLENNRNLNQLWYQDQTANNLVINFFRNRVVDYIQSNLDTISNRDGELTFRSLIQDNNDIDTNYLEIMRQPSTWGGTPEIIAMSNILNANISVNNNGSYQPVNQNSNNNNIAISYVELEKGSGIHNHYNFALTPEEERTNHPVAINDNQGNVPVVDTTNRQDNLPITTPKSDAKTIKLPVDDHGQHRAILSNNNEKDDTNQGNVINAPELTTTPLQKDEYHFVDKKTEEKSLKNDENLEINLIKNNNKIKQNVPVVNKPINTNMENLQITATKAINKYNALSKEEKLKKLNEINHYYQTLSENDKKAFKEKLTTTGLAALSGGALTAYGTKMTVSGTTATSVANAEAMEMTPFLSTSTTESLAAAETETITVAETAAAVEGGVIAGETGTAAALAPETLGLSLVIGGLAIAGTWIYFAFHHHATSDIALPTSIHHNVYDNIEKWYKFLAHDKLKIKINKNTWNEIKQNKNSQANIIKIIKNKFVINDHSGWGGSVTNEDFNTFVKVIVLHFEQINGYFEILDNENDGFVIITNTEGDWLGIE
ncbi:ankyrin repeat domain-containing protein [Spiroplasma endosymbiont of Clivina fossor]|uniref:ankyrin repeat domain-containing protein n=1 Tax=Spiroplasma endosymbiont of Clivina fossor TaxID=3066282 RepID=UPI00313A8031